MSLSLLLMGGNAGSPLERELVSIAESWARGIAPDAFSTTREPLAQAVADVDRYPLLVIWPVLPCWRDGHAAAALDDIRAGCELVLGPTMDGDLYLLGLARPLPGVAGRFERTLQDGDAIGLAARTAIEADLEIGLLRAERALRSEADITAARVDPLTPVEALALLRD